MRGSGAETVARLALLFSVAAGTLVMHHLVSGPPEHAAPVPAASAAPSHDGQSHVPTERQEPGTHDGQGPHDLLHLCLAVLAAFATALGTLGPGAGRWPHTSILPRSGGHLARVRPPPARDGKEILRSVCVIRV
ncbi:hypothetical protein H0B56_15055 [Haloechinothrix sp. YIM 98757]|uniref:Uncharacterized protein n=1 Tax=Haloechinothrix aidingensis TaxID=2752311 RepID=A0A838ACH3_9PSEU|nr:hypothetical protein [Haloechinothrix aidingensis]MBA0126868.1 hypothetical protein [Haloechinothrix aidingensis]